MKRKTSLFLGLALALAMFSPAASASAGIDATTQASIVNDSPAQSLKASTEAKALSGGMPKAFIPISESDEAYKIGEMKITGQQGAASQAAISRGAHTKSVASVADLAGEYVATYEAYSTDSYDSGEGVTITQIEGTDSIQIADFLETGITIKAKVDTSAMTISIPNQVMGYNVYYGYYDIAYCTTSGTPSRTTELEGTISSDGVITITSPWGAFLTDESYSDYYLGVWHNTVIEPANATMSHINYNTSSSSYTTTTYNVVATQTATNVLSIKNFINFGQTVDITLRSDSTALISCQMAANDVTNGDWYTYGVTYASDWSGIESYTKNIECDKATDLRTITWGAWNIICTYYYYYFITGGSVSVSFDISYPEANSVTTFDGEGTESSPYLIKTLNDMQLLADNVNSADTDSTGYARAYAGQYFSLENDIDMSGYRFTPIGYDDCQKFAGTFDGNSHTLSNLNVNAGGYAGLFGNCDTASVIKNLTLADPWVTSSLTYAGGIAAYSLGTIENCHVTGGTIHNSYTGTGGIAGLAYDISGCSVTGATIEGLGGYAGGVAGQVNVSISNCYVMNTDITVGGLAMSYPSGGVVGNLYYSTAEKCCFAGLVDGTSTSNLILGGVIGRSYAGTINKCYNTGSIIGEGSSASLGGVVGFALASTIKNCYSTGRVEDESSAYVGGITGYLTTLTDSDNVITQCSVASCYSASCVEANTDSYDTDTMCREALGTIADDTTPELSYIYYDKQLTNFGSSQYGVSTSTLTSANELTGFDSSVWTFYEGYYPRLTGIDDTEIAKLSASVIALDGESPLNRVSKSAKLNLMGSTTAKLMNNGVLSTQGNYSQIDGDSIILNSEFGVDTLYLVNSTAGLKYYYINVIPLPFEGNGTEVDPYLIKTKSDLVYLADVTTNKEQYFPDAHFLMTCDIDLESDTAFVGICADTSNTNCLFEGTFNGGGNAVHNMRLPDPVVWDTAPEDDSEGYGTPSTTQSKNHKGFVGRLATSGVVKNLTIAADCNLTEMWGYTGALVGYNYGTVDSCVNLANISTYNIYCGGIVGYNYRSGVISNCFNAGNITCGRYYAGGIAGANYGLIKNSQNAGNVSVEMLSRYTDSTTVKYAGGIAGAVTGGRFDNCVNMGTVSGYDYVGGITATLGSSTLSTYTYTNDVINCINYGSVILTKESNYVGNIGGTSGTTGELADNYYDGQITLYNAHGNTALSNTTAVETSTLISGTVLENYSTDTWDFTAGLYPVLKAFAGQEATKVMRSMIISIASGETVAELKTNAYLSSANDCVWTLNDGASFKIAGDSLIVPESISDAIIDTLVATVGSYKKIILIQAIPSFPLQGDGTVESPYLINTASEWNDLANYIANSSESLSGKYLRITADLDFTDLEIVSLGYDRSTAFDGDLDGNGKTIKGFAAVADASYFGAVATYIAENAYIHDLIVDGALTTGYTYSSGVVGKLYGKLGNVTSRVAVTSTASYVAGIVGYAYTGASLDNCVNEGTITSSTTYLAGLVAYSQTGVKYSNCANTGTINHSGTSVKSYTAGLVGYCLADTFINCHNEGEIVITNSTSAGGVAGLIGYAYGKSSSAGVFYFKNCYNSANITGACNLAGLILDTYSYTKMTMDSCYNTGDIAGQTTASNLTSTQCAGISLEYNPNSTYTNCWNSGKISMQTTYGGYIAGLFSYYAGSFTSSAKTTIKNCYNTGELSAPNSEKIVMGGILAYTTNYTTIDSCYNTASILGGYRVGGITGYLTGSGSTLSNCWNAGDVSANLNYVGGIVGYSTVAATLSSCFNVGNVSSLATSSSTICAVGGIAGQSGMTIANVYNAGDITGLTYAGGLIGLSYKSNGSITGGYSTGTISSTDGYCGNLMGNGMDNTSYWASSKNTMSGTYYLSANAVECTDTASVGLSYAELAALDMGDGWTAGDNYTYPRITTIADNDYAKAHAAAVIPADSADVYSAMTGVFYLGAPDGVTWTADNSVISYDGQMGYFNADYEGGTITMTATSGDVSVTTALVYGVTTGVESILSDSGLTEAEIVSETLYNTSGQIVTEPADGQKAIYIVRRVYSDGTVTTVKEAR